MHISLNILGIEEVDVLRLAEVSGGVIMLWIHSAYLEWE
jgi:hypothetical protein